MSIVTTKSAVPLRRLTEEIEGTWHSAPPESIRSVRIDSRECDDGSVFVALKGSEQDGHDFVADAAERGAVAAIVETQQPVSLPQFVVNDAVAALQTLAQYYRDRCVDAYVIGITGTCGKTTLKTMLADVLEAEYRVGRTPGNYNNHLGVPLTLLNEGGGEVLVAEVATNARGEIRQLARWLQPDMGLITHVGPAHLEGLESVETVAREKGDLLAELPEDGIALLPDWIRNRDLLAERSRVEPRSIGSQGSDFPEIVWANDNNPNVFQINNTTIELPFDGTGLVRDALLAAAAGRLLGIDVDRIKKSLEAFEPLPGRGGTRRIDSTTVIDGTYNANPDSMREALDRLAGMEGSRLAVLGDMKELGESAARQHREIAEYASAISSLDLVFVGSHEVEFREGLDEFEGRYSGVGELADAPDIALTDYDAVLLKASRAIGLDRLLDDWIDLK